MVLDKEFLTIQDKTVKLRPILLVFTQQYAQIVIVTT